MSWPRLLWNGGGGHRRSGCVVLVILCAAIGMVRDEACVGNAVDVVMRVVAADRISIELLRYLRIILWRSAFLGSVVIRSASIVVCACI